ncbi:MAG: MarR family transcriptional regulator [Clostridia bacterium]|nr:MarR family transcriptional regulator [Clostridia bacterium]
MKEEQLLRAWVKLSAMVKNNRITKGLPYNEAIVMMLLAYGEGPISLQEIIRETGMLKSQVNRTVNSLEEKGLLIRCPGEADKRTQAVRCVEGKMEIFHQVHQSSMGVAKEIMEIIGKEDTDAFIRIVQKLADAGYKV